jgi:hypothetical protein
MPRLRRPLSAALLVLSASSSLAFGLVLHDAWEGMVMGKDGSKIRGAIGMEKGSKPKSTMVTVDYKGDVAGSTRPWHVHIGSCVTGGPVFGDAKAYTPLKVGADGTTKGKTTLLVPLPDSGDYYVNIHESAATMGKIVACGDLLMHE